MIRFAFASLLLTLLAAPLCAQEPAEEAPPPSVATHLPDAFGELPVVGTRWFGVYDSLGKSVGTLELEVALREGGGGYRVALRCAYGLRGEERVTITEQVDLGPRLELREFRQSVREGKADEEKYFLAASGDDGKRFEGRDGQGTWPIGAPETPLVGIAQRLLLAEWLQISEEPLPCSELGPRSEDPRTRWIQASPLKASGAKAAESQPSEGERKPANELQVQLGGKTKAGALIGWRFERRQNRLTLVEPPGWDGVTLLAAKDKAAAREDRPVIPKDSPRSAVLEFLLAVAVGDDEAAAKVIDWAALQKSSGDEGPPAKFKAKLLARVLRASAELDVERIELLAPHFEESEPAGGRVTVSIPGEALSFVLAPAKPGWKIVDLR